MKYWLEEITIEWAFWGVVLGLLVAAAPTFWDVLGLGWRHWNDWTVAKWGVTMQVIGWFMVLSGAACYWYWNRRTR